MMLMIRTEVSRKRVRGNPFTLIEILSVIVIIAILMGLIVGVSTYASRRASEAKTLGQLEAMATALEAFRQDRGYYPQTSGSSGELLDASPPSDFDSPDFKYTSSNGGRPYIDGYVGGAYVDAWGRPFRYRNDRNTPAQHNPEMYDLWSYGRDGINETEDDITNWKRYK